MDILPEYKIERFIFSEEDNLNETIIYRIPSGPKSPKADGKRPALIQHGILCNTNNCTVNKPQIAIGNTKIKLIGRCL